MYKWPQGRVIRTIGFILAALICADLAYNGGYGRFAAYQSATEAAAGTRQLILAAIFGALTAAAALAAVIGIGFHRKAVDFLIEVEQEMAKVEWPKWDSLWRSTLIIAVAVVILAMVIFGIDGVILWTLNKLFSLGEYL
jgi:preprotein translocase SecE subunit